MFAVLSKYGRLSAWFALSTIVMAGSLLQAEINADNNFAIASTATAGQSSSQLSTLELHPYELHYSAKYNGLALKMESRLEFVDGSYSIEQISKAFMAEINETSRFNIVEGVIYPEIYDYQRNIFGVKKTYGTQYNYDQGVAVYAEVAKDKTRELKLPPVVFDYLNYQVQMRRDLIKHGKNYPQTTYQIERKGKLIDYTFRFVREEIIETELGKLNTIVLEKIDDKNKILMWMAVDWEYIIAKLYYGTGDQEMNLQSGKVNNVSITGV